MSQDKPGTQHSRMKSWRPSTDPIPQHKHHTREVRPAQRFLHNPVVAGLCMSAGGGIQRERYTHTHGDTGTLVQTIRNRNICGDHFPHRHSSLTQHVTLKFCSGARCELQSHKRRFEHWWFASIRVQEGSGKFRLFGSKVFYGSRL